MSSIRAFLSHFSNSLFFRLFSVIFLLSLDFTILRAIRNTLVVVDLGHTSSTIPFYEIFGALPAATLMTWGFIHLLKRFSLLFVFFFSLIFYLMFLIIFAFWIYPLFCMVQTHTPYAHLCAHVLSLVFYVMSDLWKTAMMSILFWGLVNQFMPVQEAKKIYSPLLLGASLGALAAGPVIAFVNSSYMAAESWKHALIILTALVGLTGVWIAYQYQHIWRHFVKEQKTEKRDAHKAQITTLHASLSFCWQNLHLRALAWIVITDYIAYSLGEVIFLDILREKFPTPTIFCQVMGWLSCIGGSLTIVCALFVAPYLLERFRWQVAALVTPICLFFTAGAFFILILLKKWLGPNWLDLSLIAGSLYYCLCRAVKYTLFDASKEIAYLALAADMRLRGKLMIDGIAARFGRGSASILSISFVAVSGGVIASTLLASLTSLAMCISWIISSVRLGSLMDRQDQVQKIKNI